MNVMPRALIVGRLEGSVRDRVFQARSVMPLMRRLPWTRTMAR